MDLTSAGWRGEFAASFEPYRVAGCQPARVAAQHRDRLLVWTAAGEAEATVPARLRDAGELPTVGDWLALRAAVGGLHPVEAILPRRTHLSRKQLSTSEVQLVAANVDLVWIAVALDGNYRPTRIERYLAGVRQGGAEPVVLLTKADLCDDADALCEETVRLARGAAVRVISTVTGDGLAALEEDQVAGWTLALVGSSGVGKSTLVNHLLGHEAQAVNDVRQGDHKGRHTTSHRELFRLPSGALLIDTPGMKEFALWDATEALDESFTDITALAAACRFGDCRHETEPGCAIQAALESGALAEARFESYLKMQREQRRLAAEVDQRLKLEEKRRRKQFGKMVKSHKHLRS